MNAQLRSALAQVAAVPGVRAALLATERDGVSVESVASIDVDTDALAAFATALFHRTRSANGAAGLGSTLQLALDATGGRVLVTGCGEVVLVVLAERDAGAGLIRMAMQRAARAVA
jgi:predicted regulator of Ras-like GTPase activity (Roadblock/LC7/MglB family)